MKNTNRSDVTSCILVSIYHSFGRTLCLSLSVSDTFSCTREKYTDQTAGNVQEEGFSEVAVSFYWTAKQHILDKRTVH